MDPKKGSHISLIRLGFAVCLVKWPQYSLGLGQSPTQGMTLEKRKFLKAVYIQQKDFS